MFFTVPGMSRLSFYKCEIYVSAGGGGGRWGVGRGGTRPVFGYRQERMISLGIGEQ